MGSCSVTKNSANKPVKAFKKVRAFRGAGKKDWQQLLLVAGHPQHAKDVQNLLHGPDTAREYNHAMRETHKSLKATLHIGHDDETIDDRVGRFGGNNPRFSDPHKTAVTDSLLRVAN